MRNKCRVQSAERRVPASILLTLVLLITSVLPAFARGEVTINVYNWGEYIDLDVLEIFEEQNPGIRVNYTTFDSNESMYAKILSGAASYDVVIPSDYMISKMIKEDLLCLQTSI